MEEKSSEVKTNDYKEILKEISDHITIITILFIVMGYLNLYLFYYEFGIDIYQYLDISEIIISFISPLLRVVLTFILVYFYTLGVKTNEGAKWYWNTTYYVAVILTIYSVVIITKANINSSNFRFIETLPYEIAVTFVVMLITLLFFVVINWGVKKMKTPPDTLPFKIVLILIGLVISIAIPITFKVDNYKNGFPSSEIEFKLEDRIIATDNRTVFLGMTNNYIFIYDNPTTETLIVKRDGITFSKIKHCDY